MSAEDLGHRLLGEVVEERLDEFLRSIRTIQTLGRPLVLSIPPIDRFLRIFHRPQNTTREQLPTQSTQFLPVRRQQQHAPVIELTSTATGAGKTQLLYYIIAVAVLPQIWNHVTLRGKAGAVVVFDADSHFDVQRLAHIMKHYVQSRIPKPFLEARGKEMKDMIINTLSHVHIFRPHSYSSLQTTINSLQTYLLDLSAHRSGGRALEGIILDSASAFMWSYRDAVEQNPTAVVRGPKDLAQSLFIMAELFSCPLIYTSHTLPISMRGIDPATLTTKMHLQFPPSATAGNPVLRLQLQRIPVPRFGATLTLAQLLADKGKRQEVAEQGRFEARLDIRDAGEWGPAIRAALKELGSGGRVFEFTITSEGVVVCD